jgi:hypothetical protein
MQLQPDAFYTIIAHFNNKLPTIYHQRVYVQVSYLKHLQRTLVALYSWNFMGS